MCFPHQAGGLRTAPCSTITDIELCTVLWYYYDQFQFSSGSRTTKTGLHKATAHQSQGMADIYSGSDVPHCIILMCYYGNVDMVAKPLSPPPLSHTQIRTQTHSEVYIKRKDLVTIEMCGSKGSRMQYHYTLLLCFLWLCLLLVSCLLVEQIYNQIILFTEGILVVFLWWLRHIWHFCQQSRASAKFQSSTTDLTLNDGV